MSKAKTTKGESFKEKRVWFRIKKSFLGCLAGSVKEHATPDLKIKNPTFGVEIT